MKNLLHHQADEKMIFIFPWRSPWQQNPPEKSGRTLKNVKIRRLQGYLKINERQRKIVTIKNNHLVSANNNHNDHGGLGPLVDLGGEHAKIHFRFPQKF